MDFDRLCKMFAIQEPYYGIILSSMAREETDKIPTIGVRRSGNVFKLGYNKSFLEKFSTDTVIELIKHEVLHVAFDHFSIWEDKADDETAKLRNIAADLEVNGYLKEECVKEAGGMLPERFGLQNFLGTREYFKILSNINEQQKADAKSPNKPCNGGQGGDKASENKKNPDGNGDKSRDNTGDVGQDKSDSGNGEGGGSSSEFADSLTSFDDHSEWPDNNDSAEMEQIRQMTESLIMMAEEETLKSHGQIPGEMVKRLELAKKRPKPVADWKRFFRRYLGNEFTELIRKSKKRESRRFPDAAGNRHKRKSHILVAIDTSGSISISEYNEFLEQIKTLMQSATFHIVECDTAIQHEYDFKGYIPENVHGGGGTSFNPPVDLFNSNKRKYDALVYFTDGYGHVPYNTPKETLWVISSKGDRDRMKYKKNGASVVFIPEKSR